MVVLTDSQNSHMKSSFPKSAAAILANSQSWQNLGAEMVFVQDSSGKYLSFYWRKAVDYGLVGDLIEQKKLDEVLAPVALEAYHERIERVLERRIPEQCHCWFDCVGKSLPLELVVSPILQADGTAQSVLVMGHVLNETEISVTSNSALPVNPDPYQKLLTQIARNIRRTLDLETIWQQTATSLGEALKVSRCLLISYNPERKRLKVEAENRQKPFKSMLASKLDWEEDLELKQAIATREVVTVDRIEADNSQVMSVLAVATCYRNKPNGLICLHQCDRHRMWSAAEKELVRELADQVGTAIAQATLYRELEEARNEAEEASRLKSEFLASTSHELRTPLNGIIGFLKLILEGMADDPEEQREFIEEAHSSALHLLNLINDILDIAKIEAGKMELDLAPVELDELFQNVKNFTGPQAERKKLNFNLKLPATYDKVIIYGNYQRLLQVMLNLVGNAIKFTNEGGVTVAAEVVRKKVFVNNQEYPGMVRVRVADTGIGVPLDKQDRLFQSFNQVDGSRTRQYGGTGLGLAISQKLVEAMGGVINFYSMGEWLGSTVTFTVPLYQAPVIKSGEPEMNSLTN